jgi:hypothetical protein
VYVAGAGGADVLAGGSWALAARAVDARGPGCRWAVDVCGGVFVGKISLYRDVLFPSVERLFLAWRSRLRGSGRVRQWDELTSRVNRPSGAVTRFKQQQLSAWQPILTPLPVILTLLGIGIVFLALGIPLLVASNSVRGREPCVLASASAATRSLSRCAVVMDAMHVRTTGGADREALRLELRHATDGLQPDH